ncbi:hypothetical protein ACLKMH_22805 [Psychromonas sp. KJ10-10]|uniref:hypothetical protein n=1 Tax=Psychromonas sp. KJ10-10 TaxID=3391823 RepID=UPI0039B578EE
MSKESVLIQLQENVKIIYHKAVDADKMLAQLREQKKAGFAQIFAKQTRLSKIILIHFYPMSKN